MSVLTAAAWSIFPSFSPLVSVDSIILCLIYLCQFTEYIFSKPAPAILPVVFASMAGKANKVIVTGGQDDSFNTSPWVQVFGYGKDPASFNADIIKNIITSYYGPAVMEIADRCGIEYDEYTEEHKTYTSEMELDPPCGKVLPGTISAHEFIMSCKKDGEEVTGFHFIHKVCHDQQPYPPLRGSKTGGG